MPSKISLFFFASFILNYLTSAYFLQLWEEDGLDLALIPYGCIATGPDSGFIEVVKNARTIAEVRRIHAINAQSK